MSSEPVSKIDSAMASLIESGRHLYSAKKYNAKKCLRALGLFTRAMKSCPCARGVKRDRCTCKDFEKVAAQGGSIYREAMGICHCEVGRTFSKCDNVYHIQALHLRAATFEAMGKFGHAMKDAEWILELAPQLPDGYLHLGDIALLQKNDEYAWKMYTAGIEATKESSVDSSPKLQQLHSAHELLNRRFMGRRDPICLPAEIVTQVFSYLNMPEILLCLRVSKQWTCTLTSPPLAQSWRDLTFPDRAMRDPRPEELEKMLSWAGDGGARKIVIPRRMTLTESMLTLLLEASPSLEHLEILELRDDLFFPSNGKKWKRLRHVSIVGDAIYTAEDIPGGFPQTFLQYAASSLEHLSFMGIPKQWYQREPSIPLLPKLKTLRMSERKRDRFTPADEVLLPVFPLTIAFPNLEQLAFGPNLPDLNPEPVAMWRGKWPDLWPHLKVLIFEGQLKSSTNFTDVRTRSTLRFLMCLNRGNSLHHIRFAFRKECFHDILSNGDEMLSDFNIVQYSEFQNLRSFSSPWFCLSPAGAQILMSNAILTQQLTSFDITFPKYTRAGIIGAMDIPHLEGYEWARGAPSIQALGLYRFRFTYYDGSWEEHPLVQFLATFPNLQTLTLVPCCPPDELNNLVVAILKVTYLETIHVHLGNDEGFAQLRQAAQDHDVQLMELSAPDFW
ncbi:uncharacterized protein CPUR_07192 [Claviceps purpurea 20.1]|uniref:F-box domain-containing protein n=1 Tax=Claviceps purpurea (strain 20.1) TaxID=1111077 RepID=M1WF12_CLAP2|nr:uncharacterized protein CPUR_07192 [Claviceps purpurea 20.1]